MTTDFPDYTQPTGTVDTFASLLVPQAQQLLPGGALLDLDTSQCDSVVLQLRPPATAAPPRLLVAATHLEPSADPVAYDSVSFHGAAAYPASFHHLAWQLPARSAQLQLQAHGDGADPVIVSAYGSNRPADAPRVSYDPAVFGRTLLFVPPVAVPAGGVSAVYRVPPVPVGVGVWLHSSAGTGWLEADALDFAAGVSAFEIASWQYASQAQHVGPLYAPMTALEFQMHNSDTTARNMGFSVYSLAA